MQKLLFKKSYNKFSLSSIVKKNKYNFYDKKKKSAKCDFVIIYFPLVLNQIINIKATKFKLTFLFSSKWKGHYPCSHPTTTNLCDFLVTRKLNKLQNKRWPFVKVCL